MHRSSRPTLSLLLLTLGVGCTFGTDDEPPIVDPPCGDAFAICADDCCTRVESPFYPDGCSPACEPGLRLVPGLTCEPLRACGFRDGGVDGAVDGAVDGSTCGRLPVARACRSGRCCDEVVDGRVDEATCSVVCPAGFELESECFPEPSCVAETPCDQPSECTLADTTCCGTCDTPSLGDVVGVHVSDVERYEELLCRVPEECPPCVVGDPNPNLVATCNVRQCRAVDVARTPVVRCTADTDCRLRTNSCCECDVPPDVGHVLALRRDAVPDFLALVCDDTAVCDACAPTYPANLEAFCDAGRCAVRTR